MDKDFSDKGLEVGEKDLCTLEKEKVFSTLMELLNYRSSAHPDKLAINFLINGDIAEENQISMSYKSLCMKARAIAKILRSKYSKQSRIMILCPAGNGFVLAFLACLYAGMVAVPCALPSRRERDWARVYAIASDCGALSVITDSGHTHDYTENFSNGTIVESIDDFFINNVDSINGGDEGTFASVEPVTPADIAFLQYTSGSTGNPKGVLVSHSNLMHNQRVLSAGLGTTSDSCYVSWLPLFHDMGLIGCLIQSLFVGASFHCMSPTAFLQKPFRWLQAISHFGATVSGGPNFAYDLCANTVTEEQKQSLDLSRWVCAPNGAEPIKAKTIQRFAGTFIESGFQYTALTPCYGLAEGTLMVTCKEKDTDVIIRHLDGDQLEQGHVIDLDESDDHSKPYVGVGVVVGDQRVCIVNPDTFEMCKSHMEGEVWVNGGSVGQGYWNKVEESEDTFAARIAQSNEGPFLRTGDAGFMDEHGQLFISGRYKDMMILHGRNIYPQDIEQACEDEFIELNKGCSAAFSLDVAGEEKLVVLSEVKRTELRKVDFDQLIKKIRVNIVKNFQIDVYDIVLLRSNTLLKTTSGKVQRRLNKKVYSSGALEGIASHQLPQKRAV